MALILSLRGSGLRCRHCGVETNHLDAEFGDLLIQWESARRTHQGGGKR